MSKKLNETLEYLGSGYSIESILNEDCIYRKVGNVDIEVSGLDNRKQEYDATIYVWENNKNIKSIQNIHSKEELAKHLETVFQGFSGHQGLVQNI